MEERVFTPSQAISHKIFTTIKRKQQLYEGETWQDNTLTKRPKSTSPVRQRQHKPPDVTRTGKGAALLVHLLKMLSLNSSQGSISQAQMSISCMFTLILQLKCRFFQPQGRFLYVIYSEITLSVRLEVLNCLWKHRGDRKTPALARSTVLRSAYARSQSSRGHLCVSDSEQLPQPLGV